MSEHMAWMGAGRQLGVYQVQALIGAGLVSLRSKGRVRTTCLEEMSR